MLNVIGILILAVVMLPVIAIVFALLAISLVIVVALAPVVIALTLVKKLAITVSDKVGWFMYCHRMVKNPLTEDSKDFAIREFPILAMVS